MRASIVKPSDLVVLVLVLAQAVRIARILTGLVLEQRKRKMTVQYVITVTMVPKDKAAEETPAEHSTA